MAQIPLHDGQNGLPDAMDTRQNGPSDQDTAQHAGDRQYDDCSGEAAPEMSRQWSELRHVAAHQEVVTAGKRCAHDDRFRRRTAEIQGHGVHTGLRRHCRGPFLQVAGYPIEGPVGQHQDALRRKLHTNAGVDEGFQARRALTMEYIGESLRVGVEDVRAPVLHRHLPGVPERGGEQNERDDAEGNVPEGESKGR